VKSFTRVSASQIDKHLTCPRRWYFPYIYGLPHEPQADAAALGEAIHAGQEKYLLAETPDPAVVHQLARNTLPLLDELRALEPQVEYNMARPIRGGRTFIGKIDVFAPKRPGAPLVVDWKSGNPDYFKTSEDLKSDIQMLAYGYEALCIVPAAEVTLRHVGIPTKTTRGGGTGGPVEVTVPAAHIAKGWTRIQDYVDRMALDAEKTNPIDVEANTSACRKYGRPCAYLDTCSSLKSVVSSTLSAGKTGTQENMAAHSRALIRKLATPNKDGVFADAFKALYDAAPDDGLDVFGKPPTGGTTTPARPTPAILPPEVTQAVASPSRPAAPAVAVQPAVVTMRDVEPSIPPVELEVVDVDLLFARGFTEDEVNSFPDEHFTTLCELSAKGFGHDDIVWDEVDSTDKDRKAAGQKDFANPRPQQAAVPAPVVAPTRGRTRTVASTSPVAPSVEEAVADHAALPNVLRPRTWEWFRMRADAAAEDNTLLVIGNDTVKVEFERAWALATRKETMDNVSLDVVGLCAQAGKMMFDKPAEPAAETPKRRGRPPGSANKAKETGGETTHVVEGNTPVTVEPAPLDTQVAAAEQASNTPVQVQAAAPLAGLTLYVDCMPEKGVAYRHLDEVLAPLMELVAKNHLNEKTKAPEPLTHYTLVPFNGGPGRVAAYLMANIDVAMGALLVNSSSPCAAACLEVLRPRADVIIRGIR
jgi:hypothetical protein